MTRNVRKRDSLAAVTSAPNTAPTASAASVSTTVINAASSSTPPQPSGPKPSISIRAIPYPSFMTADRTSRHTQHRRACRIFRAPCPSRRHVGLEPLLGKLFDGAVGERGADRGVELRFQLGILLA